MKIQNNKIIYNNIVRYYGAVIFYTVARAGGPDATTTVPTVVRIITMIWLRAYETIFFFLFATTTTPTTVPEHYIVITYMVYNVYDVCYYVKSMNFFFFF